MKKGKTKLSEKAENKNLKSKKYFFWLIPLVLIFIFLIYLSFFKTTSTGDDNDFINRSEYFRNTSGEVNESKEPPVTIPLPPSSSPPKSPGTGGSGGGTSPENPPEEPKGIPPGMTAYDSDYFDLNGENITKNFFKEGVCKDQENEEGLKDFCTGEEVTEYYLENNLCKSTKMKCSAFAIYYGENTQTGCYNGMCVVKDGGRNFTKKDQIVVDEILWDECNAEGLLKEWFLTTEGVPAYTFVNCSQTLGWDYKCVEGACQQAAFDSDATDFYNMGNCYLKGSVYLDHCTEYGSLIEYIVDPNEPTKCKEVDTYCPTGICSYGRCLVIDYDASSSSPYEVKSSCTQTFERNVTDSCNCLNDGSICRYLKEWVSEDNSCVDEIVDCRTALNNENAYCDDGRCLIARASR